MEKLIITVAPTGVWPTKENNPNLPVHPEDIAREVYEAWKAGAAIAHIHVREDDGTPSMNINKFRETVRLIRNECNIIINLTTSGGLGISKEERLRPVKELEPELASFDAGSMNFLGSVFENSPDFLHELAATMQQHGVKPEIEVFETGMIANALRIAEKGLIEKPLHYQFVLGVPGGMPASQKNLLHLVETIPEESSWSVIGIGKMQLPMIYPAIVMGGHVRVGMEDNVYYKKGKLAESNAEFVARVVRLAGEFDREIASPDDAREILKLQ